MREFWDRFRKNPKAWAATVSVALLVWAVLEIRTGFLEGYGWGPRQLGSRIGKWAKGDDAPEKPRLETGSIPQPPTAKSAPQPDAQKKEAAARARRARCEKERMAELVEAEKELAILGYRASACLGEAKQSIFTAGNPERACKLEIDGRNASEVRRDAIVVRRC